LKLKIKNFWEKIFINPETCAKPGVSNSELHMGLIELENVSAGSNLSEKGSTGCIWETKIKRCCKIC